ncbi:MAG: lysine biosynthesis protein LysW [Candidatus Acetothermia bacterium]|jgi:lysine biosynthesis protein LysW|nr:lysine biosynthesis protein LysW [Candidatus Acetothermia bacterium]
MPSGNCPVCDADIRLGKADAVYGKRITCPECGAILEVIEEDPLELEEVGYDQRDDLY